MNRPYKSGHVAQHRGAILGLIVGAIALVEAPKYLVFLPGGRAFGLPLTLLSESLMIAVPFLLARAAPTLAAFDKQWLPSARSHWLWLVGMVLLLVGGRAVGGWLASFREDWFFVHLMSQVMTDYRPARVLLRGAILVLFAPIAEEIFWRAFVLAQLNKLTHWTAALFIQALLSAGAHLPGPLFWFPVFFYNAVILGAWRIRFRSILPLILAHMILNGTALIPRLTAEYVAAVRAYPKCHEIDVIARGPAEDALPVLIGFIADRDELVSSHAIDVLRRDYREAAVPYLRKALASSDHRTVDKALFAVEWCRCYALKPEVRAIVWSRKGRDLQISAAVTLGRLDDKAGLSDIAEKHPEEKVRRAARGFLREFPSAKGDVADFDG